MTAGDGPVRVVTFGCRLNGVESEAIAALATRAGHRDLTVVNTCAVTAEAARQGRQTIRRLKREEPGRRIVVTGCAATVERAAFAAMPEVDAILGNAAKTAAASWPALPSEPGAQPAPTNTRGVVAVQNGCDHRCTFCIIPAGRGASRSLPAHAVVEAVRGLVREGFADVMLTGVDLTAYGLDLDGRPGLGRLVKRILAEVPELPRLRLSSLDCIEADDALLEAVADEPRLMPHMHLSLQAGADLILKRMARRHRRVDAVAFCAGLRAARPDLVFGADLIVGFPTETEAHFADTLSLVADCGLTHLHVFPFSPRPGTPAARLPPVPPPILRERASRLRAAGEAALALHLDAQHGRALPVLVERDGRGRAPDFTLLRPDRPLPPGSFAILRAIGHDGRTLTGVVLDGGTEAGTIRQDIAVNTASRVRVGAGVPAGKGLADG